MHETSLIDYALNAVEARAAQMGIQEVSEVGLVVGKAKAVPGLMEKAFQIIRLKHPMCREAKLHLDVREIRMQCAACGREFQRAHGQLFHSARLEGSDTTWFREKRDDSDKHRKRYTSNRRK